MTHCQLTHSDSDRLIPNHSSVITSRNCFPPSCMWGTTEAKACVEFIQLKITKQRPSGGLVCCYSMPMKTCLKWWTWKPCIISAGITLEKSSILNIDILSFCTLCSLDRSCSCPCVFNTCVIYQVAAPAFYLISDGENWACLFQPRCYIYITRSEYNFNSALLSLAVSWGPLKVFM